MFFQLSPELPRARTPCGVIAIKVSGCVPECFSFARRFRPPQVVKGGAVFRMAKSKRQPQKRLPLFSFTAARTEYGLSMVGVNGLNYPRPNHGDSSSKPAFRQGSSDRKMSD